MTKPAESPENALAAAVGHHEQFGLQPPLSGAAELVTEDSVALEFRRRHRQSLRYCHTAGSWYRYTGSHWCLEKTQYAFDCARQIARELGRAAKNARAETQACRASFVSGVERLCQADRDFAVTSDAWNRDPMRLGTPGGTVDLQTGELRPGRRDDYITRITAVTPAAAADCRIWLAFLSEVTGDDQELIAFLQRWLGYCLSGLTHEHALLFIYGPGGNGKGVLLNTVAGILASYSAVAVMGTFTASATDKATTDLAMLNGARLVITTETEEGHAWAEARLKALTGGDPVTARFMRRDNFTFTPAFKLTVSGNHMPVLRNVDDAARRRFNIVPFTRKPEQIDPLLSEKLKLEWPAILRWMIEGCLNWQREGLRPPATVCEATEEYFGEQDFVGQWLSESCMTGNNAMAETTEALFDSWSAYAKSAGENPGTKKWLSRALQKQGFRLVKDTPGNRRKRGFLGIALRPHDAEPHWQDRYDGDR